MGDENNVEKLNIEEKEYSEIWRFFTQTSFLIISAKASGNEILPFLKDFTSVPCNSIPHS